MNQALYDRWHDGVGFLGVSLIIGCYLLLQLGRLKVDDYRYSLFNGLGAALIIVSLVFEFNASALMIEVFWVLISALGVYRALSRRSPAPPSSDKLGRS